jgi:hypothetical protein
MEACKREAGCRSSARHGAKHVAGDRRCRHLQLHTPTAGMPATDAAPAAPHAHLDARLRGLRDGAAGGECAGRLLRCVRTAVAAAAAGLGDDVLERQAQRVAFDAQAHARLGAVVAQQVLRCGVGCVCLGCGWLRCAERGAGARSWQRCCCCCVWSFAPTTHLHTRAHGGVHVLPREARVCQVLAQRVGGLIAVGGRGRAIAHLRAHAWCVPHMRSGGWHACR